MSGLRRTIAGLAALAVAAGVTGFHLVTADASTAASYTIWQPSILPFPSQAVADAGSVELGVKFRSDIAGSVTGVRFYKGQGNAGPHVGNLWSSSGTRLATATFANETDTGWQEVTFLAPVPINPGITYIASYFAPAGHYAGTTNYFMNAGVDNPPLHALANGVDGANSVFTYSGTSVFPSSTYQGSNYWVDVVLRATVTTAPTVTVESPNAGATDVQLNPEVSATFSEEVVPSTVSLSLSDQSGASVPATVTYELYGPSQRGALRTVTLQPAQNLATSTTYTATLSGATDRSGNVMTSPVSWSFRTTATSNPPPGKEGHWATDLKWPIVGVHAAVLRTGSVLQWDSENPGTDSRIWNPGSGFVTSPVGHSGWCAGQVQLADGRVLMFGGSMDNGPANKIASIFDPSTNTWSRVADMNLARWYPAGVRLNDGRVVAISGSIVPGVWADTPEIYDPVSNTWTLLGRVNTSDTHEDLYPNAYLLPNGKILVYGGTTGHTRILDVAAQTWTAGPDSPIFNGSSAMYAPGKFLVSGGTAAPGPADSVQGVASVAQAAVVDMTAANPAWQMVSPMTFARSYHNLINLPDGTVLAVGGTPIFSTAAAFGVLSAELWDPGTGRWTSMAAERDPRMNHSTAVLLPTGEILASGGGHEAGFAPFDYFTAEVYSPLYLFGKNGRPTISSAPSNAGYGATIAVTTPNPTGIGSVALIGLSAQTHKYDSNASYIPLSFSASSSGLSVTMPSSANVASPGYYMLFIDDTHEVPSAAQIIQLVGTDPVPPIVAGMTPAAGSTAVSVAAPTTATFSKPVQPATISFTVKDPSGNPIGGTVSYNSAMNTATFTPPSDLAFSTTYTATVSGAKDLAGNAMTAPATWSFTTAALNCPCSLWTSSTVPTVTAANDANGVEVGVKFRSGLAGFITGIRFYKGAGNSGTHVGNLWSATGALLASAAFTNEAASGWQQVNFEGGVPIAAGTTYVASYYAPAGHYAVDTGYFASSGFDNPPLHAPSNGVTPNGVFSYSSSTTFPTGSSASSNYWVDVVFSPSGTADTAPPKVTSVIPAAGSTGISVTTAVSATFSEAIQPGSLSLQLRNPSGNLVAGTVSYDPSSYTATLRPASPLEGSATYVAAVTGTDLAGNPMATPFSWSFTTAAQSCPCTIWSSSTVPSVTATNDGSSVEIGVKFTSDVNGFIRGVRFYKGTGNSGTHLGNLWSSGGTLLASATFTGETASGWQQVTFTSPVAVSAGTTYVASYFAPAGHYAADSGYFANASWDNPPLHALANSISPNGVYSYSGSSAFPTSSFNATNYWVDVVFTTQ